MKEEIVLAFSYMFKDEDWFWKVFVGVFYLLLMFVGIGFFFIVGYQIETVRRILRDEEILPEWKKSSLLLRDGIKVGGALLIYCLLLILFAQLAHIQLTSFEIFIVCCVAMLYISPLLFTQYIKTSSFKSCFDVPAFFSTIKKNAVLYFFTTTLSLVLLTAVITLGWMSLIVGWPFVIFWGLLAQAYLSSIVIKQSM